MARVSFERFAEMLDQAVNRIPPHFLRDLTGGFNVQNGKKRDGGYYIMGEYVYGDYLGCFIVFYYGSFVELLRNEPVEVWETEIMDTVLHELQHHLEDRAGRDDLARKELEELAEALRQGR
ncbi:MAG: metallopeptidase family protein [Firmicutes bacterium]|nr:metallopeptidase family protein [Bacillota bacterium]